MDEKTIAIIIGICSEIGIICFFVSIIARQSHGKYCFSGLVYSIRIITSLILLYRGIEWNGNGIDLIGGNSIYLGNFFQISRLIGSSIAGIQFYLKNK